jgi:hypothetical protein
LPSQEEQNGRFLHRPQQDYPAATVAEFCTAVLNRGLDIFQAPIRKDGFSLGDRLQEHRIIKGFYVTYVRNGEGQSV